MIQLVTSGILEQPQPTLSSLILEYDSTNYVSGSTINDETSNGRDGTIVGSPPFDGDYFSFSNDYIQTPDLDSVITGSDESHSVEVWIYPTSNGVVASYSGQSNPFTGYHFSAIEIVGGNLEIGLWNGSAISSTGNIGAVSFNQWHQVVLTYDGTTASGYLDGQLAGQTTVAWDSPMDDGTGAFHINFGVSDITNQGDGSYFDGEFGIMQVYDEPLTASEVLDNYNNTKVSFPWTPPVTELVAWIDASDASSYTRSGTSLQSVTDKAGTYTMTIGGTPVTNFATQNGLNVFDFDGNNEYLQSTSYSAQTDGSGNHWAIGVFRYESTNNTKNSIWSYETNATPKRDYAISSGASNNTWPGELDLDGLSSGRISNTIGNLQQWNLKSLTINQFHIVSCWFNKTGDQIGVRVDGSNAFTPVNDYSNSIQTNQELRLMRNRASVELDGKLAEFFAVADIPGTGGTDLTDLEKAEGYLAWKWGLVSSLPSGHPYKNSAPTV